MDLTRLPGSTCRPPRTCPRAACALRPAATRRTCQTSPPPAVRRGIPFLEFHSYLEFPGKEKVREREMFYLTMHSTHFIYGYMVNDIWLTTILIVRKETRCHHIGYSYRLTARVLLYAPSHRQDSTYHSLCYTSRGALAGTRNSSIRKD